MTKIEEVVAATVLRKFREIEGSFPKGWPEDMARAVIAEIDARYIIIPKPPAYAGAALPSPPQEQEGSE